MARTYGKPADYLLRRASDKSLRILFAGVTIIFILGIVTGLTMNAAQNRTAGFVTSFLAVTIAVVLYRWMKRQTLKWENERQQYRKGARGEAVVADILSHLSNHHFVIHNIPTPYADYDHLVIGPTGIFAIETKDWRGLVATDSLGELLLNGHPTDKPYIRNFIAHVMRLREHVCEATGLGHYFQPVFVFTSADLKAKPGDTRNAHCIAEEDLFDYIENAKPAKPLPRADIVRITKALCAFAQANGKEPADPGAGKTQTERTPSAAAA